MSTWIRYKHILKIWAANGQNNLMRLQQFSIACQCHINQIAAIEKALETRRDVLLFQILMIKAISRN